MRLLKLCVLVLFFTTLFLPLNFTGVVEGQGAREAPTGFDNESNGFASDDEFVRDLENFNEREEIDEGLGPVYNAQSCAECHQNPVSGGVSQITELRAGHFDGTNFIAHPGGSIIHSRAIDAAIQERVLDGNEVWAFRTSLNLLGDGFVEAIADSTLTAIADGQPAQSNGRIAGQLVWVPVLEAGGAMRLGRFGWKNQSASLESFSAIAYLDEMGITSPLAPRENTSNGLSIASFDPRSDPEDNGDDVKSFTRFMRATMAPPRDEVLAATAEARAGDQLFRQVGCSICHVPTIVTAPVGTMINGGTLKIPPALGNKVIHPYGDFLLHDVGTGDGIVQNGGPSTRNKLRTAPLWGVRTRNRLMHDGESPTFDHAIQRHGGEASVVRENYRRLSPAQKNQLLTFLRSL